MKIKYDKQADAIYILFSDKPYAYGEDLDEERRVDYDADGNVRGVELLCVSTGVLTDALPNRSKIEQALEGRVLRHIPKVKDADIKNLSIPRGDFYSALKKASKRNGEPKPSPTPSKT